MPDRFDLFPENFQDLILSVTLRHPDKAMVYGSILEPVYFQGVLATITARCALNFQREQGRFPTFPTLNLLVAEDLRKKGQDDSLASAEEYIRMLSEMDTGDADYVVSRLRDFARERATIHAIKQAVQNLKDGTAPNEGFVKLFEDALRVGTNMDDLGVVLHADYDKVIDEFSRRDYGVRTGFPQFDKIWRSGWCPGWLIIILAPPKRYKTLTCINLALNMVGPSIAEDVLYYTCEISQTLAVKRMLQNLTGSTDDFIYENLGKFREQAKEKINAQVAGNLVIKGFPAKSVTIPQIEQHAKTVIRQFNLHPKAIIVDYAETVAAHDTTISEHQQQASIYTRAREMGDKLGCCVIMPDRCNRETVGMATPSMTSFQGAFQKAGIVDIAIGNCATDEEYQQHKQRTFVFLNRHGAAYQHFSGQVDPKVMQIDIGRKIEWSSETNEKKTPTRRARSNAEDEDGSRGLQKLVLED